MNNKTTIIITVMVLFLLTFTTFAADNAGFELVVKKVERISNEEVVIQYGVISRKDFDCFNVSIAFKIIEGDAPVACKEIKETIPKGADGTDIKEVNIKVPADAKELNIKSTIFFSAKRYRIEDWFSGCKDF